MDTRGLPAELARELERSGATAVAFVDVDARAAVARGAVTDADRAAARGGAVFRERMRAAPVSRVQKRTHHISSLAATAVASVAAQDAADGGRAGGKPRGAAKRR
jgi:hypothetical protein